MLFLPLIAAIVTAVLTCIVVDRTADRIILALPDEHLSNEEKQKWSEVKQYGAYSIGVVTAHLVAAWCYLQVTF